MAVNRGTKFMKNRHFAAVAALLFAGGAYGDGSVGLKVGTLGLGLEGTYALSPKWAIRGGLNQFDYDFEDDLDGVDYDGDLELGSATLLADYRPRAAAFRFTGGVVINDNRISAVAVPVATYDIGDTVYTLQEVGTLSADVEFDSLAPYLGLGYDLGLSTRLRLSFDAGVLFQGEPDVGIDSVGGTLSNDTTLRQELDDEARLYEDDLEDYDLYPVLSIGITYRFD